MASAPMTESFTGAETHLILPIGTQRGRQEIRGNTDRKAPQVVHSPTHFRHSAMQYPTNCRQYVILPSAGQDMQIILKDVPCTSPCLTSIVMAHLHFQLQRLAVDVVLLRKTMYWTVSMTAATPSLFRVSVCTLCTARFYMEAHLQGCCSPAHLFFLLLQEERLMFPLKVSNFCYIFIRTLNHNCRLEHHVCEQKVTSSYSRVSGVVSL